MKNLLVASTSTLHGSTSLAYLLPILEQHFKDTKDIVFIPYARPGGIFHDAYTSHVQKVFAGLNIGVRGIHTFENPIKAIENAKGIYTGGGNTFLLVSQLYRFEIIPALRKALFQGTPYLGTSAGSNICGPSMQTTNDMPIVYPPSFKTLGVLPFNINPHYLDPTPDSTFMGETRETRINEFHTQNSIPVVGLREGSWLDIKGDHVTLKGTPTARIFEQGKAPYELASGSEIIL